MPAAGSATFTYRIVPPRNVDVRVRNGRPAFVGSGAVLECAGPWRVDEGWGSDALGSGDPTLLQDAYDVLLEDGSLCRIFQEANRWYIGGVYD